jgi:hypothetical protein
VDVAITNFRLSTDSISVAHLADAGYSYQYLSEVSYSLKKGPLTLLFCQENKLQVILSSHTTFDLQDSNFVFARVVAGDSEKEIAQQRSVLFFVDIGVVVFVFLILLVIFLTMTYLNWVEEKKEKAERTTGDESPHYLGLPPSELALLEVGEEPSSLPEAPVATNVSHDDSSSSSSSSSSLSSSPSGSGKSDIAEDSSHTVYNLLEEGTNKTHPFNTPINAQEESIQAEEDAIVPIGEEYPNEKVADHPILPKGNTGSPFLERIDVTAANQTKESSMNFEDMSDDSSLINGMFEEGELRNPEEGEDPESENQVDEDTFDTLSFSLSSNSKWEE